MKYTNATKSSLFAGGEWIPQGGTTANIKKPSTTEQAQINAGQLVPSKTDIKSENEVTP